MGTTELKEEPKVEPTPTELEIPKSTETVKPTDEPKPKADEPKPKKPKRNSRTTKNPNPKSDQ